MERYLTGIGKMFYGVALSHAAAAGSRQVRVALKLFIARTVQPYARIFLRLLNILLEILAGREGFVQYMPRILSLSSPAVIYSQPVSLFSFIRSKILHQRDKL
jgi:hypothetical protein